MKRQKSRLFSRRRRLVFPGVLAIIFFASLSWAIDQPHWYPTLSQGCASCHNMHAYSLTCIDCHTDTPDLTDPRIVQAPSEATHSSAAIGSNKYGTWSIVCGNCHDQHGSGQVATYTPLVQGTFSSYSVDTVLIPDNDVLWAFEVSDLTINDPGWNDPAKWSAKTGPDRGLILWVKQQSGSWYSIIVKEATLDTIIGRGDPYYAPFDLTQGFEIHYGQFIDDDIYPYGGNTSVGVYFNGPSTMANDESGTGLDPTPNGICQVCHTQTTHWLNDGSLSNHFSGWNCTMCHPHEQGFKADPPLLCP